MATALAQSLLGQYPAAIAAAHAAAVAFDAANGTEVSGANQRAVRRVDAVRNAFNAVAGTGKFGQWIESTGGRAQANSLIGSNVAASWNIASPADSGGGGSFSLGNILSSLSPAKVFQTTLAPIKAALAGDPLTQLLTGKKVEFNPDKNVSTATKVFTANDNIHQALGVSDNTFQKTLKVAGAVAGIVGVGIAAGAATGAGTSTGAGTFTTADGAGTFAGIGGGGVDSSLLATGAAIPATSLHTGEQLLTNLITSPKPKPPVAAAPSPSAASVLSSGSGTQWLALAGVAVGVLALLKGSF